MPDRTPLSIMLSASLLLTGVGVAEAAAPPAGAPAAESERLALLNTIRDEVLDFESDNRVFTAHVMYLANDFMEGRVPGSRGAEIARQYAETAFEQAGLEPAFSGTTLTVDGTEIQSPFSSWRQAFDLGGRTEITAADLRVSVGDKTMAFEHEEDFVVTGLGSEGEFSGEAVFVGYSIADGPGGFTSYGDDADLSGKTAVILRFEPHDEDGRSVLTEDGTWSSAASFDGKIGAAVERGASAVVVVNTPTVADPRINRLDSFRSGRPGADVPVLLASPDAGTTWLQAASGKSMAELVAHANDGAAPMALGGKVRVEAAMEREVLQAENIGGILRGKGDLADEYIVIGGHIDHIGMGYFGSRWGSGKLHPGADDNASGTAAVLLLADLLSRGYERLPEDADARSIVFVAFDAEESGLNGSRYYANNPIAPIEDHVLMINFDMIGRVVNDRLNFSGLETAEGLREIVQPAMDATDLELVVPTSMSGASDHSSFLSVGVPILFSIIADFHDDYHTPEDVAWKINFQGGTQTSHLYYDIGMLVGTSPERPTFVSARDRGRSSTPAMGDIRVRFGVSPSYSAEGDGIAIQSVTSDGPAANAGVQAGDRLVRWDGRKLEDVEAWMPLLARHEPGDVVRIGIVRDGQEQTLEVTLEAR
ncbi:MAG: M28 family peptidase [Planctomycetota bacterium]